MIFVFFSQNTILTYQKHYIFDLSKIFVSSSSVEVNFHFLASMDCPSKENPCIEESKLILFDLLLNTRRKFKLHIYVTIKCVF